MYILEKLYTVRFALYEPFTNVTSFFHEVKMQNLRVLYRVNQQVIIKIKKRRTV